MYKSIDIFMFQMRESKKEKRRRQTHCRNVPFVYSLSLSQMSVSILSLSISRRASLHFTFIIGKFVQTIRLTILLQPFPIFSIKKSSRPSLFYLSSYLYTLFCPHKCLHGKNCFDSSSVPFYMQRIFTFEFSFFQFSFYSLIVVIDKLFHFTFAIFVL